MNILLNETQKHGETKSKSIRSSTLCPKTPKKNKELPKYGLQFYYGEKLPMAWGVPQQTTLILEINISQYERETKHLTLRDIESYLVLDV